MHEIYLHTLSLRMHTGLLLLHHDDDAVCDGRCDKRMREEELVTLR